MIKNERQYRHTLKQVERLQEVLCAHDKRGADRRSKHTVQRQLDRLEGEVAEYRQIKSGERSCLLADDLLDLPSLLIKARLAKHMSHKHLAEELGLKEQQIQRYEANDYEGVAFARVVEICEVLGVSVKASFGAEECDPDPGSRVVDCTLRGATPGVMKRDGTSRRKGGGELGQRIGKLVGKAKVVDVADLGQDRMMVTVVRASNTNGIFKLNTRPRRLDAQLKGMEPMGSE